MKRFKVELLSIDRTKETETETEKKDIQYTTFVEAENSDGAISRAKDNQKKDRPDINVADTWCWFAYETAEVQPQK